MSPFSTLFLDYPFSEKVCTNLSYNPQIISLNYPASKNASRVSYIGISFRHMSDRKVKIGPKIEDIAGSGVFEGKRKTAHLVLTFLGINVPLGLDGNKYFFPKI